MYGLVNLAIEDLVRSQFGDSQWTAIQKRAGVDLPTFVGMQPYPDSITYQLVGAASEELGIPADTLLEALGEYWTLYTARKGYGDILALGGRTFVEFVQNLDMMHAHIALSMPQLRPPSFWCTNLTDTSLRLHYRSERDGLAPMVIGLVRGLGQMFETDVQVEQVVRTSEGSDHDEFQVRYSPR